MSRSVQTWAAIFALALTVSAHAHTFKPCKPYPASPSNPCNPPTGIVTYTKAVFPCNVSVRYGGVHPSTGYWIWLKAGPASRACTADELKRGPGDRNESCTAKVGDQLFAMPPSRITE